MSTITLKEVPPAIHRAYKTLARTNGRSLNREIIRTLETALHAVPSDAASIGERAKTVRESLSVYLTQKELDRFKKEDRP